MKFSVIIPVFNKADTIGEAVRSVYAQTINDFEIIIVDDGSTDSIDDALTDYHSSQLRLIRQKNGGVSVARNTGLSNAKGEYVCFLDADDLWMPNHLEVLCDLIEKYPESRAFLTSHQVIMPDGKIVGSSSNLKAYSDDFETDDFLGLLNNTSYGVVHTNSMCAERSLFDSRFIRFEPGVRIGEDTDVWYRLGLWNKVAVSKCETTKYRREFSTATKLSFHIQDWIFEKRLSVILSDKSIPDFRKESVIHLIDRYRMTISREYMLANNRKGAKHLLSQVKSKRGMRYFLTLIFTFLPYSLCKKILKNR